MTTFDNLLQQISGTNTVHFFVGEELSAVDGNRIASEIVVTSPDQVVLVQLQ
jgi:hypothetical protein